MPRGRRGGRQVSPCVRRRRSSTSGAGASRGTGARRAAVLVALVAPLLLVSSATPAPAANLTVTVAPSGISVDARDVGVVEVLRELGAKAGFSVVQVGTTQGKLTITLRGAPLKDALRQLLRHENHTLVYRDAGNERDEVDKVVLLGASSPRPIVADTHGLPPGPLVTGDAEREAQGPVVAGVPAPAGPSVWQEAVPPVLASAGVGRPADESSMQGPAVVEHMLRTQATQASPVLATLPAPDGARVANEPPPTPPPSMAEALAITTQLAQRNLSALVQGLATATHSLFGAAAGR